jgi:hypothetical protein
LSYHLTEINYSTLKGISQKSKNTGPQNSQQHTLACTIAEQFFSSILFFRQEVNDLLPSEISFPNVTMEGRLANDLLMMETFQAASSCFLSLFFWSFSM